MDLQLQILRIKCKLLNTDVDLSQMEKLQLQVFKRFKYRLVFQLSKHSRKGIINKLFSVALKKNIEGRRSRLQDLKNISKAFDLSDFSVIKKLG